MVDLLGGIQEETRWICCTFGIQERKRERAREREEGTRTTEVRQGSTRSRVRKKKYLRIYYLVGGGNYMHIKRDPSL